MNKHNYIQSILSYFSSLDIDNLRLYLKDEYSYQDTTKEIFLSRVNAIFEAHKDSGDTELIIYKGECGGKQCENCGKKGFRFVGNRSGNYMDLLFETEGDNIKDIYYCVQFKTDVEIENLGTKADIYINPDDQVAFIKTPEYWSKVHSANAAYSEIITTPPTLLDFEELNFWVTRHGDLNARIGQYDLFQPSMRWTPFSRLYSDLLEIVSYNSKYLNDFIEANYLTSQLETEQNLIDWMLKYEVIFEDGPLFLTYQFEKVDQYYRWNNLNPILFQGEIFLETFSFIEFYVSNYDKLMHKYSTYTESEYRSKQSFGKKRFDIYSLRFHLDRRQALEKSGVYLPFFINQS
jgi:hypothetical protein